MCRIGDRLLDAGLDDAQRHGLLRHEHAALEEIGAHGMHAIWNVCRQTKACLEKIGADEAHTCRVALVEPAGLLQSPESGAEFTEVAAVSNETDGRQRDMVDADPLIGEVERCHDVVDRT